MNDFVENQWDLYCKKLKETAEYISRGNDQRKSDFLREADDFANQHSVSSYPELLEAIGAGAELTERWKESADFQGVAAQPESGDAVAYGESSNHEPMKIPDESISEQAEQAASNDLPESK